MLNIRPANAKWSMLGPNFFQSWKTPALGLPTDYLRGNIAGFLPLWKVDRVSKNTTFGHLPRNELN